MLELVHDRSKSENDDGVRPEDMFRRATFGWALATKKMVEASLALGVNSRAARAALADIEYACEALDKMFVPLMDKKHLALQGDKVNATKEGLISSATGVVKRVESMPCCSRGEANSRLQSHVDDIVGAPPIARFNQAGSLKRVRRGVDLSSPVHPKGGKMKWAGVDCPSCPSKVNQRCQNSDGGFVEKPCSQRKVLGDTM